MTRNLMHSLLLMAGMAWLLLLAGGIPARAALLSLAHAVTGAKHGTTVTLVAGTYQGGVTLPPGVSLKGAGYGKTIIDASGQPLGIEVSGGAKAVIADLTVSGATRIDIAVHDSTGTVVRGVRTTGSINGVAFTNVSGGRMENVLSDGNRYGLVAGVGSNNVIVNCTAARNSSLGISLPAGNGTVVFNNCVVECANGIYLGSTLAKAHIDYNLYSALYAGKLEGQVGRQSIGEWNSLCGQDAHSLTLSVTFRNPSAGDFTPVNPMSWALDRTPVSGFGIGKFAGIDAPFTDILGARRGKSMDLGAYNTHLTPPRPADGSFTVKSGQGITSAGVFTKDGKELCDLFENLPLAKGSYAFWLPSRDFQYRAIAAGAYEVRTVESQLRWDYLGKIGDTGKESPFGADASLGAARLAFDSKNRLIAGNDGWAEDFIDERGYDGTTGKFLWCFRAGADTHGIVVGNNDTAYLLRGADKDARLTKLDSQTGQVLTWKDGGYSAVLAGGGKMNGITVLNGKLFITDGAGVDIVDADAPAVVQDTIKLPGACCPSADQRNNVVWVLAQDKLVALIPTTMKGEGQQQKITWGLFSSPSPVDSPCALAVNNGRMAVASQSQGKIFFFDCSGPAVLKPLGSIGTGDGPYGAFAPDRFTFQRGPGHPGGSPSMALSSSGLLAVGDGIRILVFNVNGKSLWYSFGIFGNGTTPSYGVTPRRFDNTDWSMALDLKNGAWQPEAYWHHPAFFAKSQLRGEIAYQGQTFGIYDVDTGKGHGTGFTRVTGFSETPVLLISGSGNNWLSRKDADHDGVIDERDAAVPFDTGGLAFDNPSPRPNGELMTGITRWQCTGIDADGAPIFSPKQAVTWKAPSNAGFISPYTGKPDGFGVASLYEIDDANLGTLINVRSAPGGTGLLNGAGTDMAGFDAAGNLRWLHPLAVHKGLYNFQSLGPVFVSGVGQSTEVVCVDRDGLGLGTFGQSPISHYNGYWLDHPGALQSWQGQDGNYYLLIADNFHGMHHWYRLGNLESLMRAVTPITVSATQAAALAALPAPDPNLAAVRPATPIVMLPRLQAPLPIDGDLEKWRKLGIAPNIIITPDTALEGIDGPLDASAVIRMAYQGKDLYVQILRFAENPVFFQPVSRHYMQDCVEMCINGFGPGFKFDIAKTTDAGDMIIRQRFYFSKFEKLLPVDHAPRVIKVLDNAKEVSERAMIESVYGVDLSPDKVIVTEFKLPMDAVTYEGDEKVAPAMTPGSFFWLGFMIDNNDQPGADLQNLMVWPATYGTFNPPEDGAKAVLGE